MYSPEIVDMPEYTATQESNKLLGELKSCNIRFAHWKSNSHLSKGLAGKTDLDLLIYPTDKPLFEACLYNLGYKKIQSQPWSTYPDVDDWIGLDYETGKLLHVHAHYALVTGIQHVKHLYLPWIEVFFEHVIIDDQTGWPIPEPELEALVLFIRIWAKMPLNERRKDTPKIPSYIQAELLSLLQKSDLMEIRNLCSKLNLKIPNGFEVQINTILDKKRPEDILEISSLLYQQVIPFFRMPWRQSLMISSYYKSLLKFKKHSHKFIGPDRFGKTLCNGGKVIALIGSDGSGKSTLSRELIEWLSFKIDTHYFYLGKSPFIRSYNKTLFSRAYILFSGNKAPRYFRKALGKLYYLLLIKEKLNSLRLAEKMSQGGSIIICDRFPQKDVFGINDGPYLQGKGNSFFARQEMKMFDEVTEVEPDLVIKLHITPEIASQRKPEHDLEMIKQKCKNIDAITFKHAKVVTIDASEPYHQVLLNAKRAIWNSI
ncbi:nucleoside/nucleotide kinase family protein [Pontibacter roseus]|uniref:hypothetical protein n=1 Tax=Pontibacter roseus TaxID=336989 RepID=UPI000399C69F|nr:hypothetical protein [Pontibacter roseus]